MWCRSICVSGRSAVVMQEHYLIPVLKVTQRVLLERACARVVVEDRAVLTDDARVGSAQSAVADYNVTWLWLVRHTPLSRFC